MCIPLYTNDVPEWARDIGKLNKYIRYAWLPVQIIGWANQEEARERAYWLVLAQLLIKQRRHTGRKGRLVLILMTNWKRMERRGQSRRRKGDLRFLLQFWCTA